MTPGVNGDVVLAQILCLEDSGEGNRTRTDDKERGLERILVKEVQEVGSIERRSIVVREAPCVLRGAIRDVGAANAPTTRPPTTIGIGGSLCIVWAPSRRSNTDVWD